MLVYVHLAGLDQTAMKVHILIFSCMLYQFRQSSNNKDLIVMQMLMCAPKLDCVNKTATIPLAHIAAHVTVTTTLPLISTAAWVGNTRV